MAAECYAEAMGEALRAHKLIPQAVAPLSDAATAAVKGGLWQDAILHANKALQRNPEHINSLDALAHAYGGLEDWENCGLYGRRALVLRDKQVMAAQPSLPELPQVRPRAEAKNIIAFSLFGNSAEYIEPAVMNTELAGAVYPGWVCRFYVDGSVPEAVLQRLRANGAEVVRVAAELESWPGTMWRFLAMDDAEAGRVLFRDADSVISPREARAVAAWIESGKLFHTLRDGGTHTELILAGLWGAVAGAVPDMRGRIQAYVAAGVKSRHFADQLFLREQVWPFARQSLCGHDRIFGFMDAAPFPDTAPFDYRNFHVGANEGNVGFHAAVNFADNTPVRWTLFSKIHPLPDADYRFGVQDERQICSYEAVVVAGKVHGNIPRRYSKGFADGRSRITVVKIEQG